MNHLISDDAKTVIRQLTELFMFAYMQKHEYQKENDRTRVYIDGRK